MDHATATCGMTETKAKFYRATKWYLSTDPIQHVHAALWRSGYRTLYLQSRVAGLTPAAVATVGNLCTHVCLGHQAVWSCTVRR